MAHPTHHIDLDHVIHELKHYLPSQAPLKDFIHHNTLHAFQHLPFHLGLHQASVSFGYKTYLRLDEYRKLYQEGKILPEILDRVISQYAGETRSDEWKKKLLEKGYETSIHGRIGKLRSKWKELYHINLAKETESVLFRVIANYLDQGISIWNFPIWQKGFLAALVEMESNSHSSFFRTPRARRLLTHTKCRVQDLLKMLVWDETLYEHYLFDQQFDHPGWSGMVSVLEDQPQQLLDRRPISLKEFIAFELLLEIDALDTRFGENWIPLGLKIEHKPAPILAPVKESELSMVYMLWQEAYEWSYYDQVLSGIRQVSQQSESTAEAPFQAMFCLDDRECSFRRYLEELSPGSQTYGTPGFFGIASYYQPQNGKFYTKICPAPVTPGHLIKETQAIRKNGKDVHFNRQTHSFVRGWVVSQTLGFWTALKLILNIFRPRESPISVSSFRHMDKCSVLIFENTNGEKTDDGLQVGFTIPEMADLMESLLRSIGLIRDFAPLVYIVGHGASSVNNTHYAGYDCGACSGRPGSVNARVSAAMLNHPGVRNILQERGIHIPGRTTFVGALHDTTRDEIEFYDDQFKDPELTALHLQHVRIFRQALHLNAKERSRRFILNNTRQRPEKVHHDVKLRSLALFEPRPEYNHATNTLCIVGRRSLTSSLFLDRRAFLNSYDYREDPEGFYLRTILNAAAPVCGGINLEYYFSRVDNHHLGAGTKLPHNVYGLIGVANGADGDLRTGLPYQMVEIHDPLRLLMIVEQDPAIVLDAIHSNPATYEWFDKAWLHLIAIHPKDNSFHRFHEGGWVPYHPAIPAVPLQLNITQVIENQSEHIPVFKIK